MAGSSSAALSASVSLVVLQVVSRLFSFGLNQLLLRSTSPRAFGVATIQLDTWIGTVLFFVREGIRGAVAVSLVLLERLVRSARLPMTRADGLTCCSERHQSRTETMAADGDRRS